MDEQPQPIELTPLQLTMQAAARFRAVLAQDVVTAGNNVDPMEVWLRLHVLALELTALREMVLDTMATAEEEGEVIVNREAREHLAAAYFGRLSAMLVHETAKLDKPRIAVAKSFNGNPRP